LQKVENKTYYFFKGSEEIPTYLSLKSVKVLGIQNIFKNWSQWGHIYFYWACSVFPWV